MWKDVSSCEHRMFKGKEREGFGHGIVGLLGAIDGHSGHRHSSDKLASVGLSLFTCEVGIIEML